MLCLTAIVLSYLLVLLVPLVGCGGDDSGNSALPGPDAAADAYLSPPVDSGGPGPEAGADSNDAGGGAAPPVGTQVVAATSVAIAGVTTDDFVVYVDTTQNTLFAQPIAGGGPTAIGPFDPEQAQVGVSGSVVFFFQSANRYNRGALSLWTAAHGLRTVSAASVNLPTGYGASPDGSHVVYLDNVDFIATTGDLVTQGTDGTGKTTLVRGVALDLCLPQVTFAGAYVVAATCPQSPGAGAGPTWGPANIASFTGAGWWSQSLATSAQPSFSVDPTATHVLVSGAAGLVVYPIGGGSPDVIDANGLAGTFVANGAEVLYTTGARTLARSPIASPHPTVLANGVAGIASVSRDGAWTVGFSSLDPGSGTSDLLLTSATTPAGAGGPIRLAKGGAAIYGDGFTADSSHALYFTSITSQVGDIDTVAVSGGAPKALGTFGWQAFATNGAKVIFTDNYSITLDYGGTDTADLRWVDTSQTAAPALLVSQVSIYFFLTAARDKIVYSWAGSPRSSSGIWVLDVP